MTSKKHRRKGVAYLRVSSNRQRDKGDGLSSQEARCREYAKYKDIEIIAVFKDSKSGSGIDRPGMQEMLAFLRQHRKDNLAVIIDDVSRWARGVVAHWELRGALAKAGGELFSPSIEFGEDSDSQLVENMLASVSQHQRQKNAEQTRHRRRGRMLNGYWVHFAPRGYRYTAVKGRGKMLIPDPVLAPVIKQALEGYADGRYQTKAEVKRLFDSCPEFPKPPKGEVTHEEVNRILSRVVYAGYIESEAMDVSLRKAQHEPLITYATYERIQERMNEAAYVPTRKNLDADFPLRGFVACGDCGNPLTACWAKARNGTRHAYYYCFNKDCASKAKMIRKADIEGEFGQLVRELAPTQELFALAKAMFQDLWDHRVKQQKGRSKHLRDDLRQIERQTDKLLERIVEVESSTVLAALERKVTKLEHDKVALHEKIMQVGTPLRPFNEALQTALALLASPWKLWESGALAEQRTLMKLAFTERLRYLRGEGFQTPSKAVPFEALACLTTGQADVAERVGFEPKIPLHLKQ